MAGIRLSTGLLAVVLLTAVDASRLAAADGIVSLDTRPGVTQRFLVLEPKRAVNGAVIMFPPEEGLVQFKKNKKGRFKVKRGGWIGQTIDMYRERGIAVAVVEPPSDRLGHGMDTDFRKSDEHAEDLGHVIAHMTDRTGFKPFLVATCRATHSASSVATKVERETISGVVLASSRSRGKRGSILDAIIPGRLQSRVLFVHHVDDDCAGAPYSGVTKLVAAFDAADVKVVSVSGGWRTAERKQKRGCGANGSHKFYGSQEITVRAITDWMAGRAVADRLDAGE